MIKSKENLVLNRARRHITGEIETIFDSPDTRYAEILEAYSALEGLQFLDRDWFEAKEILVRLAKIEAMG